MRGLRPRGHPGCVTSHGASGPGPAGGTGRPSGSGTGDEPASGALTWALAEAALGAVEEVGGYAGGVYLRSETPGLLRLAVLVGLPGPLFRPWWRMHTNRPFPVAEVHRSGQALHPADVEEAMRRFPQLVASLPFPFASLYAPVLAGRERFGVLVALRAPTPGVPVDARDRSRMTRGALRLGEALDGLFRRGTAVEWTGDPVCVQLPTGSGPPVRFGSFDWDLLSGTVTMDDGLLGILGAGVTSPCTIELLTSLLEPEDGYALWAAARHATGAGGRPLVRRLRLRGPDGGLHLLEVSARARRTGTENGSRLVGTLVDLGTGLIGSDATDRLPRALLAVDRLGRVTYVNERTEQLLGRPRRDLAGRLLWRRCPGSGTPSTRSSCAPPCSPGSRCASWPARRGHVAVGLAPSRAGRGDDGAPPRGGSGGSRAQGRDGPAPHGRPLARGPGGGPVPAGGARDRAHRGGDGAPGVGGGDGGAAAGVRRAAARDLPAERPAPLPGVGDGFPQGFLEPFDGVGLDARVPGVETLTTGRPLFFESMEQLGRAYPDLPLDAESGARAFLPLIASGRPVGSCILGFDQPRGFGPEERTVLTALAG